MSSLNKVILVGNLTRDLEMRDLPSGNKVGNSGSSDTSSEVDEPY